jgi:hypothetical protein
MKIKLKSNELLHIDNSYFRLTVRQAKELCGGALLPTPGYLRAISLDRLAGYVFGDRHAYALPGKPDHCKFIAFDPQPNVKSANVARTNVSWHNGAVVKNGWVWALSISPAI